MAERGPRPLVVIACPHALETEWLGRILAGAGCEVDCLLTVESLFEAISTRNPDVIILDGCLCGEEMRTVQHLAQRHKVVMLVDEDRPGSFIHRAMQAGARGCLSCNEEVDRFVEALTLITHGMVVISRDAAHLMTEAAGTARASAEPHPLSEWEQLIAAMVAQGATNKEIGEELFISEQTVKMHIRRILEKLKVRNRQQLAAHVARVGMPRGAPRE